MLARPAVWTAPTRQKAPPPPAESPRPQTLPHPRRREPTPPEVRLAREKEKELKELERATRTIMAYNVNIKADERDIWEFFSKVRLV